MSKADSKLSAAHASGTERLEFFARLLPVALAVRLIYAAMLPLLPDEAYYWVWSRHLSAGYFDHPPMVAYLSWLGTHILGSTELGVRLTGVLLAIGTMAIIVRLALRVMDARAAVWVAAIWLTSPLLAGLGTIFTPDTPAVFFSVCALSVAAIIAHRDNTGGAARGRWISRTPMLWLLFGLFTGLALLSKYSAVLLPAAVALAMLFSAKGIAHYRRPWIYLSGIVALLVFSPVILWNAAHHWASFAFQLHHGISDQEPSAGPVSKAANLAAAGKALGIYVGEQAGVWTPILFVIALLVLVSYWRRYRSIGQLDRLLLWTGTLPLVFFGAMAVWSRHTEANWPCFAYFPISLLTARWLSESWDRLRINWTRGGIQLSLGILIVMHAIAIPPVTKALLRLPWRMPHDLRDLVGWKQWGAALGRQSDLAAAPLIANRYQDAAEASFYMPHQPQVWAIGVGTRPSAYDFFDEQPDFAHIPRALWLGGHVDLFAAKYGYIKARRIDLFFVLGSPRNSRSETVYLLIHQ